jgi:soluble lytic murein transglycosylase-like protein
VPSRRRSTTAAACPALSESIARFGTPMLLSPRSGPMAPMPAELQRLVNAASQRRGLDPRLVSALVHVESRYQVQARSPKGALGLMQIMPATGARYGVDSGRDLLDPAVNIDIGTRYLRDLHEMFNGRIDLMLAAYNAGEGAVRRYGNRIPPYPETQDYVQKIMGLYRDR